MSAFLSTLAAVFPNVMIGIFAKLFTEKFLTRVLEKVLVYGLEKAALLTTNTIDDELVRDVKSRLSEPGG